MSEVHLQMRLVFGLVVLWVRLLGCRLLGGVILQVLGQRLVLYMSQSRGLRSLCIRSFSIIGGLLFLL